MVAALYENMTEGGGAKLDLTELQEVGSRLSQPSSSKDVLCLALEQASLLLSAIQQLPQKNVLSAMTPSMNALVKPALLKHKDKDVQFLVTACISEIMRIVAPDAPYDDDTLKEIFELIVASFKGLNDKESRFFDKRMRILDSVASVRSCVVMLDLECDDLIREMFQTFFAVASEEPKSIILAMRAIMCLVLEESEEIPSPLMEVLLRNLLHGKKGVSNTGYALARAVFERCEGHLRPHIETFLISKTFKSKWRESYHDLIFELSKLNPGYIFPLVPKLMEELQAEKVEVRVKAIRIVGRILASLKGNFPENFNGLFMELLSFFSNNVLEIRLGALEFAKHYLLVKPSGPRAQELLGALNDCLQDPDVGVRRQVVVTICNFAKSNLDIVPIDSLKKVSECLSDAEIVVRRETFQQLIEVHKEFCLKLSEGLVAELESFCWIPSKLIRCYAEHDPTFLSDQPVEVVFVEELFPAEFSLEKKVDCLIVFFANFDSVGLKVFEKIFDDKRRLQQEIKTYLANHSLLKDKESQKGKLELQESFRRLAGFFVEPETELQFESLSEGELSESLSRLLNFKASSSESREEFLKLFGEKGFKHSFLRELAVKCSFALFDSEHMQTLLTKVKHFTSLGEERMLEASVGLMLLITKYFPSIVEGAEAILLDVLKDDRDFVKDGVVKVLAEASSPVPMQLLEEYNSVDLLEKLCVNGNSKQAKYAIQALYRLCGDSAAEVLTNLYGRLFNAVKTGINLPTTLKALGIVAQYNNAGLTAHWEELTAFLICDLLQKDSDPSDADAQASETTNLKICGLKMFVKSVLSVKDDEEFKPPKEFLEALLAVLTHGEASDKVISRSVDKLHLRQAAANAVVKLTRVYGDQISPQLFTAAISCPKDLSISMKQSFLRRVYKGLMEEVLPSKYACAFVLSMDDGEPDALDTAKQQLCDYIKFARQATSRKLLSDKESFDSSPTSHSDYMLFYLVHILAHQIDYSITTDGGPSLETVRPFFRKLYLFVWALLLGDGEVASIDTGKEEDLERISSIHSVLSAMKNAVDAVDVAKSDNTYLLCDIGVSLIKSLLGDAFTSLKPVDNIPLPEQIYKSAQEQPKVDISYLPDFFGKAETLSELKSGLPLSVVVIQGKRKADSGTSKIVKVPLYKRSKVIDASQEERKEKNKKSGNEKIHSEAEADVEGPELPTPVSPKRKRGSLYANENGEVSSPEMRHELVEEPKSTRKLKNLKVSVNEIEDVKHDIMSSPELLSPEGVATKRVHIFIKRPRPPEPPARESLTNEDSVETRKRSRKEVSEAGHDDGAAEPSALPISSPRGTPRRSAKLAASAGLETPKAKTVEEEEVAAPVVAGTRIRVWWPIDKKFYNGTVQAYLSSKKTHKVVYDDGDMELLKLGNERWEILKQQKESTGSASAKSKSHDHNDLESRERKDARNAKDSLERQKLGSQSKRKKSISKQAETELGDQSNRSDNSDTTEHGYVTADGEETLASATKRRKSSEKGKKHTPKSDFKSDGSTHEESPSTLSKDSRESADIPLKAWKSGRSKTH